ncbi:DUF1573 domain-containing protein [Sphingobacterium sp. HJSM2_6]|uniref:DUF1573 domain-containing protein n=1 Tax=Sphingobacterium sp. HJSM2_6 TaxID=3366264 RepID=UPI003BEBDF7D
MKKLFFGFLSLSFLIASCNQSADANKGTQETENVDSTSASDGIGIMTFKESEFDFGKVKEGEVVKHVFTFENTGNHPIIISQVSASCGCTTPSYSTTPVLPGKSGEISVEFNTEGQTGQQQKIITVASNAESNIVTVQLKGQVEAI